MKRTLFVTLLLLALLTLAARHWPRNYAYLLLSQGYTAADNKQKLERAWRLACEASSCSHADILFLPLVDDYYLDHRTPLVVVTDMAELAAADLQLGGRSELIQVVGNTVTMFGEGSLSARLFLMADGVEEWTIAVTAVHDAPPPVNLEVWLDGQRFGTLSFDKGDQSWETRSVSGKITPHFHGLTLWFVNDYRDVAAGLDRNAYIEQITITQSGDR